MQGAPYNKATLWTAGLSLCRRITSVECSNVMQGALYNKASAGQLQAHEITFSSVSRALERIKKLPGPVLEFQDLGCSAGSNAVIFGSHVLQILRGNVVNDDRPVRYTFSDLASNDWNTLVQTISESPTFNSENSKANVMANFSAQDFYFPCSPPETCHLSMSMITLHWLSNTSPHLSAKAIDGLPYACIQEAGVPAEIKAGWAAKAHLDLKTFLQARVTDLVSGGEGIYLMVGGSGEDETKPHFQEWSFPGGSEQSIFSRALERAEAKGLISLTALHKAFIPYYLRSHAEIRAAVAEVPGLEVLDVKSHTIHVCEGTGPASGTMTDLCWSIHAAALQSSTGLTDSQMLLVRRELADILATSFAPDQGARITYCMLVVRKR